MTTSHLLDIIIPTYNRANRLFYTLFMLHRQFLPPKKYHITIIDDGSTDQTSSLLSTWKKTWNFNNFTLLRQTNQGQGHARNHALQKTSAPFVLFLGDDIIPLERKFLTTHLTALTSSDKHTAFLGFTTWHPSTPPTRFRYWLEHGGPQFSYTKLRPNQPTDFWHFYTSNISLPRSFLQKETFDPSFSHYGYEDIELGYRLQTRHNLTIKYLPEATAGHLHPLTEADVFSRLPGLRKNALHFEKLHPELHVLPHGPKKLLLRLLCSPPLRPLLNLHPEWKWFLRYKSAFL